MIPPDELRKLNGLIDRYAAWLKQELPDTLENMQTQVRMEKEIYECYLSTQAREESAHNADSNSLKNISGDHAHA